MADLAAARIDNRGGEDAEAASFRARPLRTPERNVPSGLDLGVLGRVRVNTSAVERRTDSLPGRRSVKREAQAAWLLKAATCLDLTTLSGDDTAERVRRLCAKAKRPVREDLLLALGIEPETVAVAAVCVYHRFVSTAVEALQGTSIPVAAVSTGFPAGLSPHELKLREIEASVRDGAREIDVVITREYVLTARWEALYDEILQYREACGEARLKAIIATGDLKTLRNVAKASLVSMMAGADFIKTSTGKEALNATPEVTLVMCRMIREHHVRTGFKVGYKPAGGISTTRDVLRHQVLVREELGRAWLEPALFRIGASTLLTDIERQLEHHVTGRYSAVHRHALG